MAEEKIGKKQKNIEITQLLEEFKTAGGGPLLPYQLLRQIVC